MRTNSIVIAVVAILFFAGYLGVVSGQSSVASGDTNLTIWDSSDSATVYANYTRFFVNYTNSSSGEAINGSGVYCEWRHNKTGLFKDAVNMSFNGTSLLYELIADGGYIRNVTEAHRDGMPYGNYSWNVSCFDTFGGYADLSVADEIEVSLYSTSLSIENGTDNPYTDTDVWFYANYTSTLMPVSGVGLDRHEISQVVWNTSDIGGNVHTPSFFDCENKGKKDCVAVGEWASVYLYYANGSSLHHITEPTGAPYKIEIGDLDNDSYENDMVIADSGGYARVFNETGDDVWNHGLGYVAISVAIGDLDNDGLKDDFAVGDINGIVYAFNTSDGISWSQMWNASVIDNIYEIIITDLDNDGDDDVVAANGADIIAFIGENGSVIWNATGAIIDNPASLAVGDIDHDGDKDDVIVGTNGDVYVFTFNGSYDVKYTTANSISDTDIPFGRIYELDVIDLDNDGYEDDYVAAERGLSGAAFTYVWAFDNDSTQLWNFTVVGDGIGYNSIYSMSIEDVNNDGKNEIIFADTDYDTVYILNKSSYLLWEYEIGLGYTGYDYGSSPGIDISDINNDGINEIVVASRDGYAHILQDVKCIAEFNDSTSYNMSWNNTLRKWQINKSFSSAGAYSYNMICEKGGYTTQIQSSSIVVQQDTTPPNVTSVSDSPDPQGLGENVTITATVTDDVGVDTVLVGITPPGGSEVNYTMTNQSSTWSHNYLNWINGTYSYTIYANDTSGNLNNSENGTFDLHSDVYLHVKTLKDTYGANEIVNITDPFEFDLSGLFVESGNDASVGAVCDSGGNDGSKGNLVVLDENNEEVGDDVYVMSGFVVDFFGDLFDNVFDVAGMGVGDVREESVRVQEGNTYYVDYINGKNSNDGLTPETAWKESPGTLDPIDQDTSGWVTIPVNSTIIFTAGQTWNRPIHIGTPWHASPSQESERITLKSSLNSIKAIISTNGYAYGIMFASPYISVEYFDVGPLTNNGKVVGIDLNNAGNCTFLHGYIHDLQDTSADGNADRAIGIEDASDYNEWAYNTIKNVEHKIISAGGDYTKIHHNVLYQEAGFTGSGLDHGIVRSGSNQEIYNNIIWTDHTPADISFAIKIDGFSDGSGASNNKIYNNIIRGWPAGIGIMDTSIGGNEVYHNTIYLKDTIGKNNAARVLNGITLRGDESNYASNNIIRNNIVYYVRKNIDAGDGSAQVYLYGASPSIANNIITNNVFYYNGASELFMVDNVNRGLSWMETNWDGVNGNVFKNNIIANPGFKGGDHPVSNLPTGFDVNWNPNNDGLEIIKSSSVRDIGYTLSPPYNVDIINITRPQGSAWDIGAYEYIPQSTAPTRSNPQPTGILGAGNSSVNISLETNVNATCRYSNVSGTNYTLMTGVFTETGSTNHSTTVGPLSSGGSYVYYVRCNNTATGVYNDDDFPITFSVEGHEADTDNNGIIDMPELMAFIARWKANATDVSKAEVEEARGIWFGGGGYG